jgi:hypothetical protein
MVRPERSSPTGEARCCTRLAGASPVAVSQPGRRVAGSGRSERSGRTERSVESPREAVGSLRRGASLRAECESVNFAAP